MDLKQHIKYWIESAENDLSASKSLFRSGKYDWCLFIGHLVLEKLLKALFVLNNHNKMPPKTHNLNKLAKLSKTNLSREQIPNNILKSIKEYIRILNKNGVIISQAILFSSYACGRYNELSDIDIALVSDQFEGIRFKDRSSIRKYKFEVNPDIEPLPFTKKNFTKDDPFVREILETGFRIV